MEHHGQEHHSNAVKSGSMEDIKNPRVPVRTLLSVEQAHGDGVRVRRSIGRPEWRQMDPFCLLDFFTASPPAGFADHPHRGFETVTYMLEGAFAHQDFHGNKGTIYVGDLQCMTAGRGMVHSERPATQGYHRGLQLWVNLPKKYKMVESKVRELEGKHVPTVEKDGVKVAILAGESFGVKSPSFTIHPTIYLHFTLQPGAEVHQAVPEGSNAFIYTLDGGNLTIGTEDSTPFAPHYLVQLEDGDGVSVWNSTSEKGEFVLIAGQPINEPIAQTGPFVMNTEEEIEEAFEDYKTGKNGFEGSTTWKSEPILVS